MDNERKICLGSIVSTHGIRGAVKIRVFTTRVADILEYELCFNDGKKCELQPLFISDAKRMLVTQLAEVDSREEALKYLGKDLFITRNAMPNVTNEHEFYYEDLIGLTVYNETKSYGQILAVHNFGSGDVIEIIPNALPHKPLLLPFSKEIFPEIDLVAKTVIMVVPEFS